MVIKEIEFGSVEYKQTVKLRDKYLRQPLGLKFTERQLAAESVDFHLAAYDNGNLVACLVLSPKKDKKIKMRQVVVHPHYQGQSVGSSIVRYSESFALHRGFSIIYCHAREKAVSFYKKIDYKIVSGPFLEVTMPHYEMEKILGTHSI